MQRAENTVTCFYEYLNCKNYESSLKFQLMNKNLKQLMNKNLKKQSYAKEITEVNKENIQYTSSWVQIEETAHIDLYPFPNSS